MCKVKLIFIFTFITGLFFTIYSSTYSISGTVKDDQTGEELPYITITVKGKDIKVTTNVDGHFSILDIEEETITLEIKHPSYKTEEVTVDRSKADEKLIVSLQSIDMQELDKMTVRATKGEVVKVSENISQVSLSPSLMEKLPSVGEADICRALQLLPGISGNESSSGLYVRGGTPDQNLILLDGFHIYHVDHFFGFYSAFNVHAIKDVQMYKGGYPAKYGGRNASVVELTGNSGNVQNFNFGGGASFLSADIFFDFPILLDKGSVVIMARRSYTDILQSPLFENIYDLLEDNTLEEGPFSVQMESQPTFHFSDINSKIALRPNDKDIFTTSFYFSRDNLDNSCFGEFEIQNPFGGDPFPGKMSEEELSKWGSWGCSGKWSRQWNKKFYTNLVTAFSDYFKDGRDSMNMVVQMGTIEREMGFTLTEDNNVRDFTVRLDNIIHINQQNDLEIGGEICLLKTVYDLSVAGMMDTTIDEQALLSSGYIQDKWVLANRVTLLPGIRLSYFQESHKFYVEPRASAQIKITDNIRLKSAWGIYNQFINRVSRPDVLRGNGDFWLLSDTDNPLVSNAQHIIAGASFDHQHFLIDIEGYYKILSDLSIFSIISPDIDSEFFLNGEGIARGVDMMIQKKTGKYTGWIGYTLGQVEHTFPGMNRGKSFPADHDITHEIKFFNNFAIKNWDFSATWVYGTGRPYTMPEGQYLNILPNGSVDTIVHVSAMNGKRLPDYHRMDLSVTFKFDIQEKFKTSIGASVFNVYNRKNIWKREFDYVEGELIQTDNIFMGLTPSLFLNFKFR